MVAAVQTINAAIYVRVSTKGQEDDGSSLLTQEQACRAYATEHGYSVADAHVYREVFTGTELWDRPQLTAMRDAVRRGDVDVVVAYAIDRLSRDPVHLGVILSEADHKGVDVLFVTEPLDNSPEGQLIRFVRGYAAKVEHTKIRERSIRGRRARATAGKLISRPKPLYGYRFADDEHARYVVYEPEARIVRRIVDACLSGQAISRIRRGLNADGIPSPKGLPHWSHQTIHRILTIPNYTGHSASWRGEFALPAGVIPPIVTEEEHGAIRERLRHNKQFSARNTIAPEAALLRGGFVRCGYCGRVAHTETSHGRLAYRCYGHPDQPEVCPGAQIPVTRLDALVWQQVYAALTDEDTIERVLRRHLRADPTNADAAAIDRSIQQIERQQANLAQAIGMMTNPDAIAPLTVQIETCAERLSALRREREGLSQRRAQWEQALARLHDLRRWMRTVGSRLDGFDWEQKRKALTAVAATVTLYRPDHEPPYRLRLIVPLDDDGPQTLSRTTCPVAIRPGACEC